MHPRLRLLHNTLEIEIWPADVLRARGNSTARALAQSRRVLRRKRDGRYLVAESDHGVLPLLPRWMQESGIKAALDALHSPPAPHRAGHLPLMRLRQRLQHFGIDQRRYCARTGLSPIPEPAVLQYAGRDRYRRPLWLRADAARAWTRLQTAAQNDGVKLDAISGYRSHDYQAGIIARKLARGLNLEQILAVNAAPGFSEHHSGCALDIGTPGEPPAEERFELTPAFAWLSVHARRFGFRMSYPRDNPYGIIYEPWHWCYQAQ